MGNPFSPIALSGPAGAVPAPTGRLDHGRRLAITMVDTVGGGRFVARFLHRGEQRDGGVGVDVGARIDLA